MGNLLTNHLVVNQVADLQIFTCQLAEVFD